MLDSYKIIKKIFNDNRVMDIMSLNDIICDVIEEQKINKYIDNINLNGKSKKHIQAVYTPTDKELTLYLDNIGYSFYTWSRERGLTFGEPYFIECYNLNLLNVIYHEIEHAKQTKSMYENYDLVSELCREGINFVDGHSIKDNRFMYNLLYRYVLVEKNAEVMAINNLLKIDSELNILSTQGKAHFLKKLKSNILIGYKKDMSACELYYKLRLKYKEYKQLVFDDKYDDMTKLSWGLPVKKEVLDDVKKYDFGRILK